MEDDWFITKLYYKLSLALIVFSDFIWYVSPNLKFSPTKEKGLQHDPEQYLCI